MELQKLGYPCVQAKAAFLRHYREMKRTFRFELNVSDFAKLVDEFEKVMERKCNPDDPNQIFVGHLRERFRKNN